MKQYTYSDTITLINGVEISGFADGDDVVKFERLTDSASHKVGVDGEMSVAVSSDKSGMATIKLMQTSSSNKYLSGLINLQESGFFSPIFIQFKDVNNLDLVSGTQGYIKKQAAMNRGAGIVAQEWSIIVERMDLLHG